MDNLTHTLIGVAVARAGLAKRTGRGTTWILALASNLPDLDIALMFTGLQDSFLSRRTFTHSLVGMPIIALVASWIFRRWALEISFKKIFGLVLLAMGLHVLFDLMNSYGVLIFYPLSQARLELAWIFIIDLFIWGLLALPLLVERIPFFVEEVRRIRLWQGAIFILTVYVGLCGALHRKAGSLLAQQAVKMNLTSAEPYAFPEALGCHRFHGVLRDGATLYHFQVGVVSHRIDLVQSYVTVQNDPRLAALLETPRMKKLMTFFKRPVFEWSGPTHVQVFDLRFLSTVLRERYPFTFEFEVPA